MLGSVQASTAFGRQCDGIAPFYLLNDELVVDGAVDGSAWLKRRET